MTKRFRPHLSLNAKMLYTILLAASCALLVFGAIYGVGSYALEKYYMSADSVAARKAEIYARFSLYVQENGISGSDAASIARWEGNTDYVTVVVAGPEDNFAPMETVDSSPAEEAEEDAAVVEGSQEAAFGVASEAAAPAERGISPMGAPTLSPTRPRQEVYYSQQYGRLYPMHFYDGIYRIAISDTSQVREAAMNRITAVIVASVVFIFIVLAYVGRLTKRIYRLTAEAAEIGGGDLDHVITVSGSDELSTLARHMDYMRRSVIERMGNERRAWQANTELITAISHDIRTPMTSLIGYLGILDEDDFEDKERCHEFVGYSYGKAMELKELTDELFKYFLVFGRSDLEMNMEEMDGRLLLEQLFSEAEFDLRDAGFNIHRIEFEGECTVCADPMYLKRVIDNLVSNAKKYADKSKLIVILTELSQDTVSVTVSNSIPPSADRVESTKIGIRTCEKIMQHMGGSFSTHRDEEHFSAEFTLPAKRMD